MKRKNLYVMCATVITACIIYTFASFTHPTDKEQVQSVFTNALHLVENSFSNIDKSEDKLTIQEAGFSLLPYVRSSDTNSSITTAATHEATDEELASIASFILNQNAEGENAINQTDSEEELTKDNLSKKSEAKKSEEKVSKDAATDESEKKATKESTKDESEKKATKESTKDESEGKDEVVTILSISNTSCEDKDIAISTASSYVNIRAEANTDSKIVGKLYKDNAAHILKTKGDWLYIASGNVKGYVKAEYIKSGLTEEELAEYGTVVATVNTDGLNVREKTSTDSKRVDVVYLGESYPVLKQKDDWVKINIEDDGVKGFVKTEYVEITMSFSEAISIEEENALKKRKKPRKPKSPRKLLPNKPQLQCPPLREQK